MDERQTSRTQNKVLKSLVLVLVLVLLLVQPALKESDQERNQDTEIRTNMFSFWLQSPDQPSSDAGKRVMIGSDRRLLCKTWT